MQLTWRGQTYDVQLDDGASSAPLRGTYIAVWAPTEDPLLLDIGHRRDEWLADMIVIQAPKLSFEAYGLTPQAALDALARVVPAVPMSRGGSS